MFPDSEFAVPRSSYERPVPLVFVDPCDEPDVAIYVRHEWVPYILGSLKQLVLQSTWDTQDTNELNLVQQRAMLLLSCVARSIAPTTPRIEGPEFNMSDICDVLRWDDNGVLQVYCCGEWQNVPGTENAIIAGGRQPAGQPRPAVSQCKQYEVVLSAASSWILPFAVNDGDVVTISNVKGIWSDGAGIFWWYPDGNLYVLGNPVPTCDHKIGDQSGSLCHMRLIAQIGDSTYVDAYNTTFTVPDGTGPQNLQFRANNGFPLSGGDITFHVSVCSGATPPVEEWCYVMDFTAAAFGFTAEVAGGCTEGTWTVGEGWVTDDCVDGPLRRLVAINLDIAADVTSVDMEYDYTIGTANPAFEGVSLTVTGVGDTQLQQDVMVTGDGQHLTLTTPGSMTHVRMVVDPSIGEYSGAGTIKRLTLRGTGTNPLGISNC